MRVYREKFERMVGNFLGMKTMKEHASELEYLRWFRQTADFGPAHSDVITRLNRIFMERTGKNLPEGWNIAQDGETCLDE